MAAEKDTRDTRKDETQVKNPETKGKKTSEDTKPNTGHKNTIQSNQDGFRIKTP